MTTPDWICCYYGVFHTEYEYVKSRLTHHCKHNWVINKEIAEGHPLTNGEHIHIMAQMTQQEYACMNKNMIDKYKLNGSAKQGKTRQYGKEKVKSIPNFYNYMIKDGKYETSLTNEEIKEITEVPVKEKRKVQVSWTRTVAEYIIKKYPDKEWDMRLETEFALITDIMLEHLGKNAKSFDEMVFDRLFIGLMNLLPKTKRFRDEYKKTVVSKSYQRFTGQLY